MNHGTLVRNLAKPGEEIRVSLTAEDAHLLHMILGLSGEVGELLDNIKKAIIYRRSIDVVNAVEELGDIEFYLEGLRQGLGIARETCIEENIKKLTVRYGEQYSNQAAQERKDKQ